MTEAPFNLLVVDDDDLTAESVARGLAKRGSAMRVVAAADGVEALAILRGESDQRLHRPFVILLDLNMPRMSGFEFLETLRADARLRDSVVFVLSTSDAESDLARAYNECIAGYILKSSVGSQYASLAGLLVQYAETVQMQNGNTVP
jgi:CheY-like chemotaxis protein